MSEMTRRARLTTAILRQCQLLVRLEVRDADADQAQRPGPVAERAVEQPARVLTDSGRVVDATGERGRATADLEVRIAHLGSHSTRCLAARLQAFGDVLRHAT